MASTRRIDIMAILGVERCKQIIAEELNRPGSEIEPLRGCWLSKSSPTEEGYCRRSVLTNETLAYRQDKSLPKPARTHSTIFLHKIAYVSKAGENCAAELQCSHLCDRPSCFNPDHITTETGQQNRDRRFCGGQLYCPWHNNHLVFDSCEHSPQCIKPPRKKGEFHCCLRDANVPPDPRSSRIATESFSQANALRSTDFSDLPSDSLDEGPIQDDDDPLSGGPQLEQPQSTNIPSSPPTEPSSRRRQRQTGDDETGSVQHRSKRLRIESAAAAAETASSSTSSSSISSSSTDSAASSSNHD